MSTTNSPGTQHIKMINMCLLYFPKLINFFKMQKELLKKLDNQKEKLDNLKRKLDALNSKKNVKNDKAINKAIETINKNVEIINKAISKVWSLLVKNVKQYGHMLTKIHGYFAIRDKCNTLFYKNNDGSFMPIEEFYEYYNEKEVAKKL